MTSSRQKRPPNNDRTEVRRCIRCIMPENYPEVVIDSEGVCNFCRGFDSYWGNWINSPEAREKSEKQLRKIFEAAKSKKKPYDILIGVSGGKDSSYMLYLLREVYGLNALTFTNDSGILTEKSRAHIEKLVTTFNVPHIYCSEPLFAELTGVFARKTGNFCAVCELSNFNLGNALLREYDIPLFAFGSSSRTEAGAPKHLNPWDPWYFKNVIKGEPYRERIHLSAFNRNYVVRDGIEKILGRSRILVIPDYVEWDDNKISAFFKDKFGFDFGEEHSDCRFYRVARYLYGKKYNGNSPKTAKLSLLVRTGAMSREEALQEASQPFDTLPEEDLNLFLEFSGLTREEFEASIDKTPAPYLRNVSRLFNFARKKMRRQAG